GQIAEQMVGQALQTFAHTKQYTFSYWFKDKKNSLAEVDFMIQWGSKLIPIEVKSGKTGRLKSLHLFMQESSAPIAVRIHSGNFYVQDIERADGSTFKLASIPFYLAYRLEEILDQLYRPPVPG
ncbi:MAG: DUF4143 domain-containing protein, partial [bacterium]|nr:DUF4143 domain-containing protein [bacterium]